MPQEDPGQMSVRPQMDPSISSRCTAGSARVLRGHVHRAFESTRGLHSAEA